jgi:GT2 family glycosyltransferase
MLTPKVTLIVTQRERFSLTKISLESILADDSYPFQLIYIDGGSPSHVARYLQEQSSKREFMTLIRRERYLRANEARNLAWPMVKEADYIVFLDNDLIVERGWLKSLVDCAEQEGAAIVAPLIFEGDPQRSPKLVHIAGVNLEITQKPSGKKSIIQKHLMHHAKLGNKKLQRCAVDAVEFHCTLVRRSLLERVVLD